MTVKKILVMILPLLITPLLAFMISENIISFGAGDKDLLLLIPWCIWSVIFIITGSALWRRKLTLKNWMLKSLFYSLTIFIFFWLCLLAHSVLST
jgi:hypothetical protein